MAAVTQRIPNFLGGVSKQPDDKKVPGQVREAINSYPDPTFGLSKRPGTKWLGNLSSTPNEFLNGKWFYINRDPQEQYIGVVYGANIKIWNVLNPAATVTVTNNGSSYLTYGTSNAKESVQVLTVQDTTIVVNKQKTITTQAAPSFSASTKATVRLFSAEYGASYSVSIKVGATTYTTASYVTKNAEPGTNNSGTNNVVLNAEDVLTQIYNNLVTLNTANSLGLTLTQLKGSIEISRASAFTATAKGGISGEELRVFQDEVDNFSQLPSQSLHNRVVKINNTVLKEDSYYAKFIAEDGVSGKGSWEETVAPNVSPGLTASTMPHQLVNTGLNAFTFGTIPWDDRIVGDDITNEHPSFVGKTIQQAY